ncbi:MAG: DUF1501 domain-containing protein [Myxococcota bacterium]
MTRRKSRFLSPGTPVSQGTTVSRRALLRGGAAALGTAALGTTALGTTALGPATLGRLGASAARADVGGTERAPRRLVLVYARGGWDTTYSIDPKPDVATIDGAPGVVRRFADLEVHTAPSRPSVGRFFERWGEQTAVVHGIEVRSFVHRDCEKRVLTGTPRDDAPDVGALTASCLGADRPIPYLVLGSTARAGDLESLTGRVGLTNQLLALADPAQAYPDFMGAPNVVPTSAEEALLAGFRAEREASFGAAAARRTATRRAEELRAARGRADQLRQFIGEAGFGERALVADPAAQLEVGIEALRRDFSQAVMVEIGSFDTHENNALQNNLHELLFASLDGLMGGLEDAGLSDETMVVVVSEMGRTPLLNPSGGKDHWPVASAMIVGAGVRGGRTFGRTTSDFKSVRLDLETGEESAAGARIQTANFAAGVLEAAGVNAATAFPGAVPLRAFHG